MLFCYMLCLMTSGQKPLAELLASDTVLQLETCWVESVIVKHFQDLYYDDDDWVIFGVLCMLRFERANFPGGGLGGALYMLSEQAKGELKVKQPKNSEFI